MHNITIRCVHTAIVARENQSILRVMIVFVVLSIQHTMRMRSIVIRVLPGSTVFFHTFSLTARFSKERKKKSSYWTQNVWFNFLYNFHLKHFSF